MFYLDHSECTKGKTWIGCALSTGNWYHVVFMISRQIKLFWSFLFKHEKKNYKLKHFLFQYFSKVLAGTHLINEICLNVYPILFFICKIYFLNKHILMTCLGVQSISYPEYLQINRMMNIHYTVTGNKVYYTNI